MPGVMEATTTWMRVWVAYLNLGSENPLTRQQAMQTLRDQGDASLFVLRQGLGRVEQPRVQFGSAVVLHWLGKPAGMQALMDVIRYRDDSKPETLTHLENALLTIGAPDAVTALLTLWPSLPDWNENHPYIQLICRVWKTLRDPRALEGLAARDLRLGRLFEETVAAFGILAYPYLKRMIEDTATPARRLLALATLRRIPGKESFQLLVPLLYDGDPYVRGQAPEALERVSGPVAACRALTESVRAGYSTHQSVNTLCLYRPPDLEETLFILLSRYSLQKGRDGKDTPFAVMTALQYSASPPAQLTPVLCALLEPPTDPLIAATAARMLGERGLGHTPGDQAILSALWTQLCDLNHQSRAEAAAALLRLGDPFGEQMLALIEDCRPKGGLLQTLQVMLRGGPDAGQAASRAMMQVTQWFNRLSKETAERLGGSGAATDKALLALKDRRLIERLRQMLERSLDRLSIAWNAEELEDVMGVCVGLIRAMTRAGEGAIPTVHDTLLRALTLVKYNAASEVSEVGKMVREAAVAALIHFYGQECLPLLINALNSSPPVQITITEALGGLGDVRALPALQTLLNVSSVPVTVAAQNAISAIKRTNPEMMTLLRASSSADARPDMLLRPASGNPDHVSSDLLLRPSSPGE